MLSLSYAAALASLDPPASRPLLRLLATWLTHVAVSLWLDVHARRSFLRLPQRP